MGRIGARAPRRRPRGDRQAHSRSGGRRPGLAARSGAGVSQPQRQAPLGHRQQRSAAPPVARDNASLTRHAYVEFDLAAMLGGEQYSDFRLLWLTCHRTRFEGERPESCLLERWTQEAASSGVRALDRQRVGVERALTALGRGFIGQPNPELKRRLRSGELSTENYHRQVLRAIYRLLFLLVAESRDLLVTPEADAAARKRYERFYSVGRLVALADRQRGSPHTDLWEGFGVVVRALSGTALAPSLELQPLGSFLWSPEATPDLNDATIDNAHLLEAVRALAWVYDEGSRVRRPVDYRNLGAEELGSVYESLLELRAEIDLDRPAFRLVTVAGNERKTTGSYYTPAPLISRLLDEALDCSTKLSTPCSTRPNAPPIRPTPYWLYVSSILPAGRATSSSPRPTASRDGWRRSGAARPNRAPTTCGRRCATSSAAASTASTSTRWLWSCAR